LRAITASFGLSSAQRHLRLISRQVREVAAYQDYGFKSFGKQSPKAFSSLRQDQRSFEADIHDMTEHFFIPVSFPADKNIRPIAVTLCRILKNIKIKAPY